MPVIWPVDRMKYALLKANLGGGQGLLVYPILLSFLPLSGRGPDMTEILLTGTLSINSINLTRNNYGWIFNQSINIS